jgi:hypothetical protein
VAESDNLADAIRSELLVKMVNLSSVEGKLTRPLRQLIAGIGSPSATQFMITV